MIESYAESKVVMAPSGELLLALPVYANQNGMIFDNKQIKDLTKEKFANNVSIGIYEKLGYLLYHPDAITIYVNSLDEFVDMGKL
jgi:hypothetical protein